MEVGEGEHMHDVMDSLLDGLSELIYVSNPDTYRLLYLNQPGRELYGADAACGPRPCYEVLQGLSEPCPFCTNDRLNDETFLEWRHTNPITQRSYLLRDKYVTWEGSRARLEIAFDITDLEHEKESFKFLADANALNIECIKMLGCDNLDAAIPAVLRMLGEFLQANRTYIFSIAGERMTNSYEWCAEGVMPEIENLRDLPVSLIDQWVESFSRGDAVIIENVADLVEQGRADEYEVLAAQGIESLVAVPLESEGRLVGYLGADDPRRTRLEVIEKPLLGLASFISASIERSRTQLHVDELTWNDTLTGAYTRSAFHHDFDGGTFENVGFLLVDADRLAVVNSKQGRHHGDEVLRRIASCMQEVFGPCVYRVGDDEFCAVKSSLSYEEFNDLFAKTATLLIERDLPASAGLAWSERCSDVTELLDTAGERMRRAKRGRHRAQDMGVDLASNAALNNLIRPGGPEAAVEAGLLDIYLMPQTSTDTGKLVGAEALIRYLDPARNIEMQPVSFIPALEDMGEIAYVDFFALARACETVARWQREGRPVVPLSVNFSRMTVGVEGFVGYVKQTVSCYGVDPSLIEIEVTESARGRGGDLLRQVTDELRTHGFRVAVDDFGVDNANVSLFTQLSFDVLKLDKSLVSGLHESDHIRRVVSSVAALCNDLGIQSVAEGIETQEQLDVLGSTGCTRAQGYHIGRPVPIAEFERTYFA